MFLIAIAVILLIQIGFNERERAKLDEMQKRISEMQKTLKENNKGENK